MDAHGIEQAWLLTWEVPAEHFDPANAGLLNPAHIRPDGTHPGIPLSDLLVARDHYPEKFLVGYCPNPAMPNAASALEAAVKIHDVRVCGEWKFRMLIDDPRCIELFRTAGSLGLPVVLHLDVPWLAGEYQRDWHGGTIENLERALVACPETNFIGHAPGFWREIAAESGNSGKYPLGPVAAPGRLGPLFERNANLYADLSAQSGLNALRRDPAYAREFLARYGDRLLFGRDYYGGELAAFLAGLGLLGALMERIGRENARSLVRSA